MDGLITIWTGKLAEDVGGLKPPLFFKPNYYISSS